MPCLWSTTICMAYIDRRCCRVEAGQPEWFVNNNNNNTLLPWYMFPWLDLHRQINPAHFGITVFEICVLWIAQVAPRDCISTIESSIDGSGTIQPEL